MSRQLRLEGPTLDALHERVLAEHGRHARIVAAERIVSGGIRGFFAKAHYEVTVALPESGAHGLHSMDLPTRVGLAALLREADSIEQSLIDSPEPERPSTATPDFAALLEQMSRDTAPAEQQPALGALRPAAGLLPISASAITPAAPTVAGPPPQPLQNPGDLVLCIGVRADAELPAGQWARTSGAEIVRCAAVGVPVGAAVGVSAAIGGRAVLTDRREAAAARARGVERAAPCIAVLELAGAADARDNRELQLGAAAGILPDQVWLVVDATRKSADTEAWVAACRQTLHVDGIVAFGADDTATPNSVDALGLPVLWHTKG